MNIFLFFFINLLFPFLAALQKWFYGYPTALLFFFIVIIFYFLQQYKCKSFNYE